MKIARFFAAVAVLTVAAFCVSAQQKPAATPAAPPTAAPQNVAVPDSKMAMIYSDAFLDPKAGIARFNSLLSTLNREFQPRQAELQAQQTKINTLTKEIEDTQNVADPNAIRTKCVLLAQMTTLFKRKGEDAEASFFLRCEPTPSSPQDVRRRNPLRLRQPQLQRHPPLLQCNCRSARWQSSTRISSSIKKLES